MEKRKVQKTGGSSYIVTLPKQWVEANGIEKNDTVGMFIAEDGTLIISPDTEAKSEQREKRIDLRDVDEPKHLFRYLVGSYIMGYTAIEIICRERIDHDMLDVIRSFVRIAIGPEIVDETPTRVKIKDLLDPSEMPMSVAIKRMMNLTLSMHQDAVKALLDKDENLASTVVERDLEIDRLHWLVAHQYSIFIRTPVLMSSMNMDMNHALFYFLISRIFERIGDHAVNIASHTPSIEGNPSRELRKEITETAEMALLLLEDSMKSWFSNDIKLANHTRDRISTVVERCNNIEEMALKLKRTDALIIGSVNESIRRTAEYSGDICELVINHLLL